LYVLSRTSFHPVRQRWSAGVRPWRWWPLGGCLLAVPFLFDGLWPLVIPGFMAWLRGLDKPPGRLFWWSYMGGICFVFGSLLWMYELSPVIHALTALVFGLYFVVFAAVTRRIHQTLGVPLWIIAPLGIVLMETLQEYVTIFPVTWLHFGYLLWGIPQVMQVAELGGISVLSALLMLIAAVLYCTAKDLLRDGRAVFQRRTFWLPGGIAVLTLAATLGYGAIRLRQIDLESSLRVALVQANLPQALRSRDEDTGPVIVQHATLSLEVRDRDVDLVVWPESTVRYFIETSENLPEYLGDLTRIIATPLLIGSIGLNAPSAPPSNSAFVIDKNGEIGDRADKHILVPFAETLPVIRHFHPLRRSVTDLLSRTMGFRPHLSAGTEPGLVRIGDHRVGILICYDDAVPDPAAVLLRKGAEALFTLSNEAWFADRELAQHLAMATVRCIETRLPMARATHTGCTCIIDPCGRITASLPFNQEGVLYGTLQTTGARSIPAWVRPAAPIGVACITLGLFGISFWPRATGRIRQRLVVPRPQDRE